MNDSVDSQLMLFCRAGSLLCALPARAVRETMRPLAIEAIAGMPPFMVGVSVVRGRPTPVLDTQRMLDRATDAAPATRWAILGQGAERARCAALAVTAVLGLATVQGHALEKAPRLLDEAAGAVVEVVGARDAELLVVLDELRVVPDAVWAAVDARRSHP